MPDWDAWGDPFLTDLDRDDEPPQQRKSKTMAKKKAPQQPEQTEGTELALFPKLNLPDVTGITEEMNATFKTMFTRIEDDIAQLPTDMSDPKNRAAVASYAYKISRTKTGLDEAAASVASDAKQIVDSVNAERRTLKETLDDLRDKAREKLTEWERKEGERKHLVQALWDDFGNTELRLIGKSSQEIADEIDRLRSYNVTQEKYGEDAKDLDQEKENVILCLIREFNSAQRREAEQRELEQLRREKAEREAAEAARIAEEERKAREAEEAKRQEKERARIEQEAKERAAREAEEKIAAERREREAAEQRAKEAEEREKQRIEDEKRRATEAEEARKEAAARAEEEARRREEQAKQEERDRIERERLRQEQADRERAADLAHRKKLNGEAVAGLMAACGLSEKDAQAVVIAIYKGQIAHIAINY